VPESEIQITRNASFGNHFWWMMIPDERLQCQRISNEWEESRPRPTKHISKKQISACCLDCLGPKKKARQWQEQTRKSRCIYKFDAAGFQLKPKTAECEEQNRMKRRWTLPDKCHDVSDDDVGRPTTTAVL